MPTRTVDVTLISARGLNTVNPFAVIKAYAISWIEGSPQSYDKKPSPVDEENGSNPNWNFPMKFMVEEAALVQGELELVIEIRSRGIFGDEEIEIGRVSVLLPGDLNAGAVDYASYWVLKSPGEPNGLLNTFIKIGERIDAAQPLQPAAPVDYAQARAFPYLPGPSSFYPPLPPLPYAISYPPPLLLTYGSSYPPLPPPPYGSSYPPPLDHPPQNQHHPQWKQCVLKLAMNILIQLLMGSALSPDGPFGN